MGALMRSVRRDQLVANFEELVAENQIQTATDLLISAEPEDQALVILETRPDLLQSFLQALDVEDKLEVTDQLAPLALQHLRQIQPSAAAAKPASLPGREDFAVADGRLRKATPASATVAVYQSPSSAAQRDLLESVGIDEHMLESALDPDEISAAGVRRG